MVTFDGQFISVEVEKISPSILGKVKKIVAGAEK